MKLAIKVCPGAATDEISGFMADVLKIRVRAPAERGKANIAVEKLLAKALDISGNSVYVVSGKTSPRKTVEINGLSKSETLARLDPQFL